MKNGIFKRIFVLYSCLILLSFISTEIYITNAVRNNYIKNLKENLAIQAILISNTIPFQSANSLDRICKQLKIETGSRVTIIRPDGRVIGDSDTDSRSMDDHSSRLEIQQASLLQTGMTIRYSDTLKYDALYLAYRVTSGDKVQGYVRLSMPLRGIDSAVNRLRIRIITVVSIVLLATGLFPIWQMNRVKRLTKEICDFSLSLTRGELGKKLFLSNAGEFHSIAESLNSMSHSLQQSTANIEKEKTQLNVILRNIPDALLISNSNNVVLYSSSAARMFFGDGEIRGRRLLEVVRNREYIGLLDQVRTSMSQGSAEILIEYPEEREVVATVSPLSYREREFSGFVSLFHDVTRLKKLERTRKDFIANVSHELKTPIASITGYAETLLDGALDDRHDAEKFLEIIRNNSTRLQRLVDDLLTLSRIELGDMEFRMTPVDIRQVIENTVALMRTQAAAKEIAVTQELEQKLPSVIADADRLTQVLLNLLDNAIKFTPESGRVWVRARIMSRDEGGWMRDEQSSIIRASTASGRPSSIMVSVEDTGPGIPPMLIPRLGERFYRVDPARSRDLGGTGLGLAIVKHILQAHASSLVIRNSDRKGIIASFLLKTAG